MSDIKTPAIELPVEMQLRIRQAAEHLKRQFAGVLNAETIERFMYDSLDQLMENARIPTWLPLLAERFAKDRLRALVRLQAGAGVDHSRGALPLRAQCRALPDGSRLDASPVG